MTGASGPAAREPRPVVLAGRHVRLEPLTDAHAEDLLAAGGDDEVWRWLPVAAPRTHADIASFIAVARAERLPWAVVATATGRAIGSTSYLDIDVPNGHVEIGWTWLGRAWWRTAVNTECKLLLLGHAFDDLGMERVSLKTDSCNHRSQTAITRLGATREGVLRHRVRRRDGSWRDTVYFSIVSAEWPAVGDSLRRRLAETDKEEET